MSWFERSFKAWATYHEERRWEWWCIILACRARLFIGRGCNGNKSTRVDDFSSSFLSDVGWGALLEHFDLFGELICVCSVLLESVFQLKSIFPSCCHRSRQPLIANVLTTSIRRVGRILFRACSRDTVNCLHWVWLQCFLTTICRLWCHRSTNQPWRPEPAHLKCGHEAQSECSWRGFLICSLLSI